MAEVWTAQLHIADGKASEDAPEIAYAERRDERGRVARLYLLAEPERPGSEQFIDEFVTAIGEEFVEGAGSLTGILQRAIRQRHEDLLDWNRNSLPRDQASYGVSCLIQRGDDWYLAQMGPSLIYYREDGRLLRRRPSSERSTPAIGTNETGAPEFSELNLGPTDWALLISSDVGATLPDDLLHSLRGLPAEDVLPSLYPHLRQRPRLSALVVAPDPSGALAPPEDVPEPASEVPAPPSDVSTPASNLSTPASDASDPTGDVIAHAAPSASTASASTPSASTPVPDSEPTVSATKQELSIEPASQAPLEQGQADSAALGGERSSAESPAALPPSSQDEMPPGTAVPSPAATARPEDFAEDDRTPIGTAIRQAARGLFAPLGRLFRADTGPKDDLWDPPSPAPSVPAKPVPDSQIAPAATEGTAEEHAGSPSSAAATDAEAADLADDDGPLDDSSFVAENSDDGAGAAQADPNQLSLDSALKDEQEAPPDDPTQGSPSQDREAAQDDDASRSAGSAANPESGAEAASGDAPPSGTVEFRLQAENSELGQLQAQLATTAATWPTNPFTANPAPVLDTADAVDARRIVRPLFGLGTSMPSFRRRSATRRPNDYGGGAGIRSVLLGLAGLVLALTVVAGALLVPDLITDSERSEFDQFLEDARQGLTAATLTTDPAVARLELELAQAAVVSAQELRPLDLEATILEQEIVATLQQANAIVRPPELIELLNFGPQSTLGFLQINGDTAFILDDAARRVFAADIVSGQTSVIFEAGQEYLFIGEFGGVSAGNPIDIEWTATTLGASLTILDDAGQLFRYSETGETDAYRTPNPEVVGSADGLTTDASAIYLLDATGGVVWRFPVLAGGILDSGQTAIGRAELGAATDLAIAPDAGGGTIFVSSSDGRIRRFVDGRDQGFPLTLDRPLLVPTSLVVTEAANVLYLVDRGHDRVLVVSLAGDVLLQIRDTRLAGVRGVFVDEPNQQIYYVTASTLLVSAMPVPLRR
jgi:hypothetical protein